MAFQVARQSPSRNMAPSRNAMAEPKPRFFPAVHKVLRSPGTPLDATTLAQVETRFSHDFSRVRVHNDVPAGEAAQAVDARAFTVGHHVVFGDRQFAPRTTDGMRLLVHELTHVVQQSSAAAGADQATAMTSPADSCEQQAEMAARGGVPRVTPLPSPVLGRQPAAGQASPPARPPARPAGRPAAQAPARPAISKNVDTVNVKNCHEASDWLRDHDEAGNADVNMANQAMTPTVTRRGNVFTASVDVQLEIDPAISSTRITAFSWPKMTAAEQRAMRNFTTALQAHEDGHITRAEEVFRAASGTIRATGSSGTEAVAKLTDLVGELHNKTQERLDAATAKYDKTTDHGRNQAAVGGTNVFLDCPEKTK